MSAIGKVAIEGFIEGLLTHAEASGVLKRELGVQYLDDGAVTPSVLPSAKKVDEGVVLTLSLDEAKTLVEYLDIMTDPPSFRLANRSLYDVNCVIGDALAA